MCHVSTNPNLYRDGQDYIRNLVVMEPRHFTLEGMLEYLHRIGVDCTEGQLQEILSDLYESGIVSYCNNRYSVVGLFREQKQYLNLSWNLLTKAESSIESISESA